MKHQYSDETYNLRIELDTKNCDLSPEEIERLEEAISLLREPVKQFPVAELFLTITHQPRSQEYRIKAVLGLPMRTLATGELDERMYTGFRRCIDKLNHKLRAYKDELEDSEAHSKHETGNRHDVVASRIVNGQDVEQAVRKDDYLDFRKLTFPYEESVRKRVGRWVQRYPEFDSQIGEQFFLSDVVEEVFLNAFNRFDSHPREVPFGDWLESLIDPSIKLLLNNADEELENVRFAKTAVEASQNPDY